MKYYLFAGSRYYPTGGAWDYQFAYPTLDDAVEGLRLKEVYNSSSPWAHITDVNMNVVCRVESDLRPDVWRWQPSDLPATREEIIKYDLPLDKKTPNGIVADWLEDHDRPDAAKYIRSIIALDVKKLPVLIKVPDELLTR